MLDQDARLGISYIYIYTHTHAHIILMELVHNIWLEARVSEDLSLI